MNDLPQWHLNPGLKESGALLSHSVESNQITEE
jgi:hypothetical protein